MREETGPRLPPVSVAIRLLMAEEGVSQGREREREQKISSPLDETPAPISMSGSSTTMPLSMVLPPVPPYSAVSIHLRSASVSRSIGIILTPVW